MKRGLPLVIVLLAISIMLFISCTQNTPEAQTKAETEITTAVAPPTTEPKVETEFTRTVAPPTYEPIPASFSFSDLTITPEKVTADSPVTITILVTNTGELSGSCDVTLKIDETEEAIEKVTLEGGANQIVTFTVARSIARTYSIDINSQSGIFMVESPPLPEMDAFMKGIHFNDWGLDKPRPPMLGPLYYPTQADVSLKDLAITGANWISVIVRVFQETISSTNITSNQYGTASDKALRHVIDLAHSLGMRVALLPSLALSNDPDHWNGEIGIAFTTEAQWQKWFTSYREFINHYATFAQDAQADLFYIGSELPGVTHREDDWRRIIKEVRERYKGRISYDSVHWGFPQGECERIKWWDAVDYVATDVWYTLTDKNDPTLEELKQAWIQKGYLAELERLAGLFDKPFIISEIGYESKDRTNFEPALSWLREGPEDLEEQADCYQAALEALWGKPWLKGIFWWQWSATSAPWPGSPQGKPAEEVLKRFYLTEEKPPVTSATVAFMRYTEDSGDEYVFLVETDGTGLRKLTPDQNVRESFPQFSPDGKKIVFSRWPKDGVPNIWVMNSDGTDRVRLTNLDFADMPAWSPDGKHIAFVSKHDNQLEISVMDSSGSNIGRITNSPSLDMLPIWSPDGTRIAFLSDRFGTYRWWVINADGSGVKILADIEVYEKDVSVPLILLRGIWGQDTFLSGEYFITPKITTDEQIVIEIDIEKGTMGNLTLVGIQNMIEVLGASTENVTKLIGTFWSEKTNSFDIECLFSEEKIVEGPENDFASSCMVLEK
jgi:sugar phosphate isomerase/epimerase